MSYVDYLDLRAQVAEFSDLMAYTFVAASLGTTEGTERTWIILVSGVTQKGFHGTHSLIDVDAFAPLTSLERLRPDVAGSLIERGAEGIFVIGRLAKSVRVAEAQAAMQVQAARMARAYPPRTRTPNIWFCWSPAHVRSRRRRH